MQTNDTLPLPTDFSAKRDRRHLASRANGVYRDLKRAAHKRDRRAAHVDIAEDGEPILPELPRRCTGWDVS